MNIEKNVIEKVVADAIHQNLVAAIKSQLNHLEYWKVEEIKIQLNCRDGTLETIACLMIAECNKK